MRDSDIVALRDATVDELHAVNRGALCEARNRHIIVVEATPLQCDGTHCEAVDHEKVLVSLLSSCSVHMERV